MPSTERAWIVAAGAVLGACGASGAGPERPRVCEELAARSSGPRPAQCGPTLDFTPIHRYGGEVAGVEEREDAVALIGGTCTGTLIAAAAGPVVLTAGHCAGLGDRVVIAFNVEDEPDGDPLVTEGTVIEHATAPDYALLALDALPAATAPTPLTTRAGDLLAVIQHPRGMRKAIAEGAYLDACGGELYYTDLDTLIGSSGAGVLNRGGYLVGIHTDGDCATDGSGTNRGATAAAIVEASAYLGAADLADR